MKQFDLETYNRLVSEGKTPKIVTRDGRDVRILCTDRKYEGETIVALMNEDGDECIYTFFPCGRYLGEGEHKYDLFFADTEPTYRPYKDAEECFRDVQKHGGWFLYNDGGFCLVSSISDSSFNGYLFHDVLKNFIWADDGQPCGKLIDE